MSTAMAPSATSAWGLAFHENLRQGFLEIARSQPQRCVVIDARPAISEVAAKIRDAVHAKLKADI